MDKIKLEYELKETEEIKRLFNLYLEGSTNPSQEERLFKYLNNHKSADEDLFEEMEKSWLKEPLISEDTVAAEESLNQIWARVEEKQHRKIRLSHVVRYAAAILLFMTAGLGWYTYQHGKNELVQIELLSRMTQPGEKLKMLLPDSSVVYLGGNSRLTWPARFIKGKERNVRLEGEAFFEVKHDTTSPFMVQTSRLRTRVLGTSFNIYAYAADKSFSVTVRTGKVAVAETMNGKQRPLSLLTAGMKLIYKEETHGYSIDHEQADQVNGWLDNRFVFRGENVAMMLRKLQRYYNVSFELKNENLEAYRFNVTFVNKSIKDVMEQLRIMSGNRLQYKMNKQHTVITIWEEAGK